MFHGTDVRLHSVQVLLVLNPAKVVGSMPEREYHVFATIVSESPIVPNEGAEGAKVRPIDGKFIN